MVGHVAPDRARIWMQGTDLGWWTVEVRRDGGEWQSSRRADGRRIRAFCDPEYDLAAVCEVLGLEPGQRYEYRLRTRKGVLPAESEQSFRTPPLPGTADDLTLAFGSCAGDWGPDPSQPVFRSIDSLRPDVFVWMGDNLYYARDGREWSEPRLMSARWRRQRAMPHLQPLLRRTAHYAIWDDHDYGPDNSDKTYVHKNRSLELFTRYWANPSFATNGEPGVWHRFAWGRVELFLLDTRYHRDPDWQEPGPDKALLGEAQWKWLSRSLRASRADFKVIVSATQVLARYHAFESWSMYPADRERLLRMIREARISGVLFLSGDRHSGEALRWDRPDAPYPLYEFTSSPLAAGIGTVVPDAEAADRIPGTSVAQENFGMLRFDFSGGEPELHFTAHDVHGKVLHEGVTVKLSELQP